MVGQQGERGDPPIATATVARLYMEQGRLEQAERLYQALLRQRPRERALVEGLAEVRRRIELTAAPADGDRVTLESGEGGAVTCRWRVTSEGLTRARLVLEGDGELILHVVGFPAAKDAEGSSIPLDIDQGFEGNTSLTPPRGATMIAAAVGLRSAAGRFVAAAHCPAMTLTSPPTPKENP